MPGDAVPRRRERLLTAPRRRVLRSLLRAALTSTVLVVLYYRLPLTGTFEASTVVLLLAGLALFAGVITWQVRAILRSPYPGLRAIEALAAAIPLFLLVFAAAYVKLAAAQPQHPVSAAIRELAVKRFLGTAAPAKRGMFARKKG